MRNKLSSLPKRKSDFISPMDCAPVSKLPDGSQWLFEIKLDGYRAVAVKSDRGVNLFSRRHKSFTHQYPHLVEAFGELPEGTVVDGEVVALDDSGGPDFNLLQNFRSEASRIHYFIFDLLVCQDRDLTGLPLSERRKLMKSVLKLRSPHLRIAEQFDATANDMIAAVRQQQLEGVVGKRKDRTLRWYNINQNRSRNFGGYMKKRMRWGSSTALVLILAFSVSSNGQSGKLTMSGVVTSKQSHTPIQGATVTVVGNKANQELTDAEGSFILRFSEGVREGEAIRIHVEKPGYQPYDKLVAITSTVPLQVSLLAIKTSSNEGSATGLCGNQNPVKIISIPGRNYDLALRIRDILKEGGCDVDGPLPRTDEKENPRNNEVRYFHQKDKADASRVAELVRKETNRKCEPIYVTGYEAEPKGQLEIWIKQ